MYDKIFKRIEQKYLLSYDEYNNLFNLIDKYLEKDKFYESKVCNLYFDTYNNDLIINSIEKPIYKEKVRVRSYGTAKDDDFVFLEIKNKYKETVGKRRVKLSLKEYNDYINNGIYDDKNQIMKEIDYLVKHYDLKPKIFIAYDRLSYKTKEDLRITFDFNLRSRRDKLNLSDISGKKYFDDNSVIMEIKTLESFPLWLVHALSDLKIYPQSFSKYGNIYKREIIERECEAYV